ncbi:S16 family serine protease [Microbacterium sp. H1-D42]|uniref:S16 family serine protease n=1 Tax=Microbacterium sp. H1-D42 TaxID=2925844 RepID=UPI001F530178|nr:S16 family serine protease [Microbacterium sp. H1-D42]UNK70066.1 hypothetical protein MNR00_12955 [Microbacterium sp. H1-D42]
MSTPSLFAPREHRARRTRRRLALVAIVTAATTALSGCFALPMPKPAASASAKADAKTGPTSVTIPVMLVSSGGGGGSVGSASISIAQGAEDGMTVEVAESEVSGIGESFRAAAWNSVIVSTLMSGASVENDYRFEMHGMVDGPSAGGVSTVALLSLIHGDELADDVAMTGTITATGTIGPVGGIPEKVQAIADDGRFTKALIPLGSRNSRDSSGAQVDVVRLGKDAGIDVVEVGDITQAYREFTGVELTSGTAPKPKISDEGYTRLEVATQKQVTAYVDLESRFLSLSPTVQEFGWGLYEDTLADMQQAERLLDQGLPGGAFVSAVNGVVLMAAAAATYDTIDAALTGDVTGVERALRIAGNTEQKIINYISELNTFKVATLADAEALATSYGNGFDALTVYQFAQRRIQPVLARLDAGEYSADEFLNDAVQPLLFLQIAESQLAAADAIFEIGRGLEGPAIDKSADAEALGAFLRRASEANLEVFDSAVLRGLAEGSGLSMEVARARLGGWDVGVELAYTSKDNIHAITSFMGEDNPNAAYAMIGHGWLNYARNASLVDKYYNNGIVDPSTFELSGVRSEPVLMHTLDFARDRVSAAVDALEQREHSPALIVGAFESDSLDREGDVDAKFTAIQGYTGSYAMARILAYLGGFPEAG